MCDLDIRVCSGCGAKWHKEQPTTDDSVTLESLLSRIRSVYEEADSLKNLALCCDSCVAEVLTELEASVLEANKELSLFKEAYELLLNAGDVGARQAPAIIPFPQDEGDTKPDSHEKLRILQADRAAIAQKLKDLWNTERKLRRDCASYQSQLLFQEDQLDAVSKQISYAEAQLRRLRNLNVINDTFYISHNGPFATINGLRLGKCAPYNVSWMEINSAWGQLSLLIEVLMKRCGLEYRGEYKIIPRGQFSLILRKKDKTIYELYGADASLMRLLSGRKFDMAMVAFLTCVNDLINDIQKLMTHSENDAEKQLYIPFQIEGDKVGGESVRLQFNQESKWTKALRLLLIDIKWIVKYVECVKSSTSL